MHSRVFVLSENPETAYLDESDIYESVRGKAPLTDYVVEIDREIDEEQYIESIQWIERVYDVKLIEEDDFYKINLSDPNIVKYSSSLITATLDMIRDRLGREKSAADTLESIEWIIEDRNYSFLFYAKSGLYNEMEIQKIKPREMYIVQIFDYHF